MRIYLPNISGQNIGGGFTFRHNLIQSLKDKCVFEDRWQDADIYFITSVTMVDKQEVKDAKKEGKKIVLRIDNMPRKSRNSRMSPAERMREFAQLANGVVFQSKWAQERFKDYLGIKGQIIYNGVNTAIFRQVKKEEKDYKIFLVVHYNRDENKRMPEAFDMFTDEWKLNKKNILWIVGRFSPELVNASFDFFQGEQYKYFGVKDTPEEMALIMQKADVLLYPSYSDALPNTVIEAKACGLDIWHKGHAGIPEACTIDDPSLERMGAEYLKLFESI